MLTQIWEMRFYLNHKRMKIHHQINKKSNKVAKRSYSKNGKSKNWKTKQNNSMDFQYGNENLKLRSSRWTYVSSGQSIIYCYSRNILKGLKISRPSSISWFLTSSCRIWPIVTMSLRKLGKVKIILVIY